MALNMICKPHLVDLLRHFDRNMWLHPRIRYASVRSKPELIRDLERFFTAASRPALKPRRVVLRLRNRALLVPGLEYDLAWRKWVVDGVPRDFPRSTREKPVFLIERGKVTLDFSGSQLLRCGLAS